jgi:Tfp pilus assembly protein PilX
MRNTNRRRDSGIALLLSVLALLLLSAVAAGMIYMASTENSIAANFKSEETEYFAARAGIEEVRDRMIPSNGVAPYNINAVLPPTNQLPSTTNQGVVYILQNNPQNPVTMSSITSSTNPLYDDELCHDFAIGSMSQSTSPNVRCGLSGQPSLPSGSGWYNSTLTAAQGLYSQAPNWNSGGVSNPLDWKWTRISVKATNSTPYCVDPSYCTSATAKPVCYNGTSQVAMTGASCSAMGYNPVYLLTSLAVNATGTRRVVQAEIAQDPQTSNQPAGLYATGTGCNPAPLDIKGNVSTGSFNSSTEGTPTNPPSNQSNTNGDVGANGGISLEGSSPTINGSVSSTLPPGTTGCPLSVSQSGHPTINGTPPVKQVPSYIPTTPTIPPHTPTSTKYKSNATLTAGTYGDIQITASATLTLTGGTVANPAIYNFNSITEAGSSTLAVTGPVVINIAGVGQTTVLDLSGNGFTNSTNVPNDMVINYGGTGAISIQGGPQSYFVLNAPLASLTLSGNSNFYGSAVAQTITLNGTPGFYWDQATIPPPTTNTNPFNVIAMRELSY